MNELFQNSMETKQRRKLEMPIELTEADVIEPEKTAFEPNNTGGSPEERTIQAINEGLKRIEAIIGAVQNMTYGARQQQAQASQEAIPQRIGTKKQPTQTIPTPQQPFPSYPETPNTTQPDDETGVLDESNFKDYFENPKEVMTMMEAILAILPDKIFLSDAAKLLHQNLTVYGRIQAKDARKQVKLYRPLIEAHLKQFFPKEVKQNAANRTKDISSKTNRSRRA